MMDYLIVKVFIDGEQISQRSISMNSGNGYSIHDKLLGVEISKNAIMPTDLLISIEWVKDKLLDK